MISIQTEARIAKLFLELARGENTVESTRRIMTNNCDFDSYQIFNYLDIENKNRIDCLDVINYLNFKKFQITDTEAQLIILFYDQNFDGVLTYDEFKSLLLSKNSLNSKPTAKNFLGKIRPEIDECLFHILENEVRLARNCLSILEELKTRKDFNIHSIYHILRGNNCINEQDLKNFMMKTDVIFSDNDLISLFKRLDLNKDSKIDLAELHAFLGYPDCSICCTGSPCTICKMKDCNTCFKDSVCYFHNRIHDDNFNRYIPENKTNYLYINDLPKINQFKINNDNNKEYNISFNINNNYKTSPQINNSENYHFDYNKFSPPKSLTFNNNQIISSPKKISKNLTLRVSPERKFSPNRLKSPSSLDSLNINKNDEINNVNKNLEINNDINNYLYERRKSDERQFLNYLKDAMITEQKIEKQKIKLSLNKDFNCEDAFRIFEDESKEILSKEDLKYGLKSFNINPSDLELDLLMNKYSLTKENILEYGDFFDIIVPFEKQYRNNIEERIPNSTYVVRSSNIFSQNTRNELQNLFNLIINEENRLNNLRKEFDISLKKNNLEEFFKEMDITRKKYFDEQEFLLYIQKKGIFIDENACDLMFIRLDKNRNGIVEFKEMEKEFNSIFL